MSNGLMVTTLESNEKSKIVGSYVKGLKISRFKHTTDYLLRNACIMQSCLTSCLLKMVLGGQTKPCHLILHQMVALCHGKAAFFPLYANET